MNELVEKYRNEQERRAVRGLPPGDYCQYCGGGEAERSITGYRVCASCGAEKPKCYGYVFGVPVYDYRDYLRLMVGSYIP